MAAISKEDMNRLKSEIRLLQNLDQSLVKMVNDKMQTEHAIRGFYKELQSGSVEETLSTMEIEKINIDKDGIRIAALQNAGIVNIQQVSGMSVAKLQQIEGIGQATAEKIAKNASMIRTSVERSALVKLDASDTTPAMQGAMEGLYFLIKHDASLKTAQALTNAYSAAIRKNIQDCKIVLSGLKWMFSSKTKKEAGLQAADRIKSIAEGEYTNLAQQAIENYQGMQDKKVRMLVKQDPEYVIAFTQNAAPFYAMLEAVMGDAIAKAVPTGLNALPEELLESIENYPLQTGTLKATLRRYQTFGTKYILHQERVLLGDEMGLGKTMQAIAAMCHLAEEGAKHFLVVCPLSVVVNWKREVESQTGLSVIEVYGEDRVLEMTQWGAQGGVAITSYETLNKVPIPAVVDLALMVVDEAHYVKNPQAQRTKSVVAAMDRAKKVLFMSGTPLENRVEEMQFLIQCLQPEVAKKIQNMKQLIQAEAFRKAIAPVYLRRVREDVLKELPELVEKEQWGIMNKEELQAYKASLKEGSFMSVRQVSWQLPDMQYSTKAQRLLEIHADAKASGRKVIIFSFFKDVLQKVSMLLGTDCIGVIDGSVSSKDRQAMIDQLSSAPAGATLVCQILAGGVGLNIQAASVVVFCEPQIKPSLETQAIARAYRMGQSQSVMVHRLLMDDSVDERVMEILQQKAQLFDSFADESLIGAMDTQINESAMMKDIIAEERKRFGIEDNTDDVEEMSANGVQEVTSDDITTSMTESGVNCETGKEL
ncbi:MAG: DEAD/DEAH box helicase [Lachnospiraceae bacterium]|nr:DEAD/DEAH box helicase [Lachnospiraceae bacterium]